MSMGKNGISRLFAVGLGLMWVVASYAQDAERILAPLKQARPDLNYGEPRPSPIAGMYEVSIENGPSVLVTADGRYFIAGDVFEVQATGIVNLAEQQRAGERREMLASLDPAEMIMFKPTGETKATITVFTDVDCGYCRKLHNEISDLNDFGIEVHYLAYPRAGLGSPSYRKIATAWCADNRQETLTRLKNGESIADNVCEPNPVAAHLAMGGRMGVTGTPALILEDGTLVPGYKPAADLAALLGIN